MALDPTKIRVAAGRVYAGTTPPATGVALGLSSGVPGTGTELGLTQGEAVFSYQVTYMEELADQILGPVEVFSTKEEMSLEFVMMEYEATKVKDFLGQAVLTVDNGSTPKTDLFTIGSSGTLKNTVTKLAIVLVSPIPATSPQRYTYIMLYKSYQSEAAKSSYAKEKSTVMKVTYKAIADVTRNDGDYMGQLVIERN